MKDDFGHLKIVTHSSLLQTSYDTIAILHLAVLAYEANLNGVRGRACETMKFDSFGKQVSGEAMYGASI